MSLNTYKLQGIQIVCFETSHSQQPESLTDWLKMKTCYGKQSGYPPGVYPLPDEEKITVLKSATKHCGYLFYVSHIYKGKNDLIYIANLFLQKTRTNHHPPKKNFKNEKIEPWNI